MMLIDRHGNPLCEWCGGRLPDHRLGHETCGGVCEAELRADRAKPIAAWEPKGRQQTQREYDARRQAKLAIEHTRGNCVRCRQPNPEPQRKCCPQCRTAAIVYVQRWRARTRGALRREAAERRNPNGYAYP